MSAAKWFAFIATACMIITKNMFRWLKRKNAFSSLVEHFITFTLISVYCKYMIGKTINNCTVHSTSSYINVAKVLAKTLKVLNELQQGQIHRNKKRHMFEESSVLRVNGFLNASFVPSVAHVPLVRINYLHEFSK